MAGGHKKVISVFAGTAWLRSCRFLFHQFVHGDKAHKVIGNVEGSAHATYVLGIGGVSKRAIKENAIADMYRNACLTGAQAVTNVTTTMKARFYLFWWEYDFIASGQIIEFTE